MACELLIHRNINNYSHPNINKHRGGVYKKGDIVGGKTIPHAGWGNKEKFEGGRFVMLRITDATWEELQDYAEEWRVTIDYEKIGEDLSIDGHRFKIFSTETGVHGLGKLTRDKIENYLNGWNVNIHSVSNNEVVVNVIIPELLKSKSFWDYIPGEGLENIKYNQISYDKTTGERIIHIDYSNVRPKIKNRTLVAQKINKKLLNRNITVTSHNSETQTGIISVFRNDVLRYFKDEIKNDVSSNKILYRRKYYIDPNDVDSLVQYSENHNNEPYEITKTQLFNYVKSILNKGDA